jgi:hypothetical protein
MECEAARRALSERDGRLRRNRRLRAHLRACEACRGFQAAISQRRSDLRALCPPLPAVAASGLLNGLLGGTGTGGLGPLTAGLTGGAAGGAGAAGPLAVKGASIAAAVAIGAGAADMSGVELPAIDHGDAPTTHPAMRGPAPSEGDARMTARASHETLLHHSRARGTTPPRLAARNRGRPGGRGEPSRRHDPGSPHPGEAPATPASETPPAISNGNPPAHASAGGNPPAHASAGGGAHGHGRPSSSPGLGNLASNASNPPGQARGAAGSPPEHGGPARGSAVGRGPSGAPSSPAGHEPPAARGRSSIGRPR